MKSEPPSMAEKSRLSSREKFIGALSLGQGRTIKAARFSGPRWRTSAEDVAKAGEEAIGEKTVADQKAGK